MRIDLHPGLDEKQPFGMMTCHGDTNYMWDIPVPGGKLPITGIRI